MPGPRGTAAFPTPWAGWTPEQASCAGQEQDDNLYHLEDLPVLEYIIGVKDALQGAPPAA